AWRASRAAARASAGASISKLALVGKGLTAGNENDVGTPSIRSACFEIPPGSEARSSGVFPIRITGGTTVGSARDCQDGSLQSGQKASTSRLTALNSVAAWFMPSRHRFDSEFHAVSKLEQVRSLYALYFSSSLG